MKALFLTLAFTAMIPFANADDMKVSVVKLNAQPALVKTQKAKLSEVGSVIGTTIEQVKKALPALKLKVAGPAFTRTLEVGASSYSFESGIPVDKTLKNVIGFKMVQLPAGNAVKVTFVGPLDKNYKAYTAAEEWIKKNKKTKAGNPWETYLDDPSSTPSANMRSEIFYPFK